MNKLKMGQFLKSLRENKKMSQADLAAQFSDEFLEVSANAISSWEKGKSIPDIDKLNFLADYYGVTVDDILDGEKYEKTDFDSIYHIHRGEYFTHKDFAVKFAKEDPTTNPIYYSITKEGELVRKRFKKHIMSFIRDDISSNDTEELTFFLKNYFVLDENLNISTYFGLLELDYMLYKLFYLEMKINSVSLLSYEKGDLAVSEYLELIGKECCDMLLTNLTLEMTDDEIENSLAVKRLIEFGARCFFTRKHIQSFEYNEIDEDVFKQLRGVSKNKIIQDRYDFFKEEEKTNRILEMYDPYSWKNYAKSGYEYLIDASTTNKIRDIVLLKNNDPRAYYKKLIERDAKFMEAK